MFLILGLVSMTESIEKRSKGIRQSLEITELNQSLLRSMSNVSKCSAQLFVGKTIDLTGATATVPAPNGILDIPSVFDGIVPGVGLLAAKDQLLPGTQTGLKVQSIQLRDVLVSKPGIEYRGRLTVTFDSSSTVMAMRPAAVSVIFLTSATDPISAKKIVACASESSQGGGLPLANFSCPSSSEAVVGFDGQGKPICAVMGSGGGGGGGGSTPPSGPSTTWKLYSSYCSGPDYTANVSGTFYSSCSSPGAMWTYCRAPLPAECVGVAGANYNCFVAICQ
jgi:hypothetical protein